MYFTRASFIIILLHNRPDVVEYLNLIAKTNRPETVDSIPVIEIYEVVPQLNAPERVNRKYYTCLIRVVPWRRMRS
jgi:hypothetical protein